MIQALQTTYEALPKQRNEQRRSLEVGESSIGFTYRLHLLVAGDWYGSEYTVTHEQNDLSQHDETDVFMILVRRMKEALNKQHTGGNQK